LADYIEVFVYQNTGGTIVGAGAATIQSILLADTN
jgi:hypothetical protein